MKQLDSAQKKKFLCGMEIHEGSVPPPNQKSLSFNLVFDECREMSKKDWDGLYQIMKIKWPGMFETEEKRVELFSAKNMLILWMVVVALGGVSTLFLAFNIRYEWLAFFAVFALSEFIALNLVLRKEI